MAHSTFEQIKRLADRLTPQGRHDLARRLLDQAEPPSGVFRQVKHGLHKLSLHLRDPIRTSRRCAA